MICPICKRPTTSAELAAYRDRCEECFVNGCPRALPFLSNDRIEVHHVNTGQVRDGRVIRKGLTL